MRDHKFKTLIFLLYKHFLLTNITTLKGKSIMSDISISISCITKSYGVMENV